MLVGAAAIGSWPLARAQTSSAGLPADLVIIPRSEWGGDLPAGPVQAEAPGDVRFLLVHHTASANDYGPGETVGLLRGFYDFHTGEKAWPDVAYNFFVDRHGQVFEGRTGSLSAPIKADATGGSQGFAQLACFVGDHSTESPTLAATSSMIRLLAWLADTYAIDTTPGASATFVSRGSNLHPAGATVTTATIAGHRDMSQTACPGDGVYGAVRDQFPTAVTTRRTEVAAATTTSLVPPSSAAPPNSTAPPTTSSTARPSANPETPPDEDTNRLPMIGGLGAAVAATAAAIALRIRQRRTVDRGDAG